METTFITLLNLSISASWLILAVLLLRLLLKRVPRAIHCLLWALVFIRLLVPVSWESVYSLLPSRETISPEILYTEAPAITSGVAFINGTVNPVISEVMAPETGASITPIQSLMQKASIAWIIGAALLLLCSIFSYVKLRRRLRTAVRLRDNLWQSEAVSSPFVLGVFRPRIYLPFQLEPSAMGHIIAHEEAHIRRRDHWIKPIAFLILTVHWFNPLIWLSYILLCRDIELACDERVVRSLNAEDKKAYSTTLVDYSTSRALITACPLAFGEVGVRQRVKNVLSYKKPAFWVIVVALLSCLVVAVCFMTVPKDQTLTIEGFPLESGTIQVNHQSTQLSDSLAQDLVRLINEHGYDDFTPWDDARINHLDDWMVSLTTKHLLTVAYTYYLLHDDGQYLLVRYLRSGTEADSEVQATTLPNAFASSQAFRDWMEQLEQYLYDIKVQTLYGLRFDYIGDNTAVSKLIGAFQLDERFGAYSISLDTKTPGLYGVYVQFQTPLTPEAELELEIAMTQCGYSFIPLVGNANHFGWEYSLVGSESVTQERTLYQNARYGDMIVKHYGFTLDEFDGLYARLSAQDFPAPPSPTVNVEALLSLNAGSYVPVEVLYLPAYSSMTPEYYLDMYSWSRFSILETSFSGLLSSPLFSSVPRQDYYGRPYYEAVAVGNSIETTTYQDGSHGYRAIDVSMYSDKVGIEVYAKGGSDTGYRIFLMDSQLWLGHWSLQGAENTTWGCDYLFRLEHTDDAPEMRSPLTLAAVLELSYQDSLAWSDLLSYYHEDVGSGRYVYQFPIDPNFDLIISSPVAYSVGDIVTSPVYLVERGDGTMIDILTEEDPEYFMAVYSRVRE